jgi:hypothetical protein
VAVVTIEIALLGFLLENHHFNLLQQLTKRAMLPADFDGLEQQEAIIDKRIEEVNNHWSMDDEENGDYGNKNCI